MIQPNLGIRREIVRNFVMGMNWTYPVKQRLSRLGNLILSRKDYHVVIAGPNRTPVKKSAKPNLGCTKKEVHLRKSLTSLYEETDRNKTGH